MEDILDVASSFVLADSLEELSGRGKKEAVTLSITDSFKSLTGNHQVFSKNQKTRAYI